MVKMMNVLIDHNSDLNSWNGHTLRPVKCLLSLTLLLTSFICLGQGPPSEYINGEMLRNLKAANRNVYYRYELDTLRSTYVKFDRRGRVQDFYFDYPERPYHGYLRVDSTSGPRGSYSYALVDGNGNRLFNAITRGFNGLLVIGGYHGQNLYGRNYSYYSNKRLSTIREYGSMGKRTGNEIRFDKKKGYKIMERSFNDVTGEIVMVVFNEEGSVDFQLVDSQNESIRYQYDKKGMLLQVDTLHNKDEYIGTSVRYYPDGSVKESIPFVDNLRDGIMRTYFSGGRLRSEVSYQKGKAKGEYTYFDKEGNMIESGFIIEGRLPPHPSD